MAGREKDLDVKGLSLGSKGLKVTDRIAGDTELLTITVSELLTSLLWSKARI